MTNEQELPAQEEKKSKRGGKREGAGRKPSADGGACHRIQFRFTNELNDILNAHRPMANFVVSAIKEKHYGNQNTIRWHKATKHIETKSQSPNILILKNEKVFLSFDVQNGEYYIMLDELRNIPKEDD